ncbi:class I SAM-dependent DNA methyltransferase [Actinomadura decatromicini]|uniref:Methyltransferase domain-containing protein n=1 Tax=Actinomadura decatromicini TaxID=2604572 RepID=A0A5D3FWP4_9ACTN|nr:class I SAM-dependent methyltransferase [Actinomadura decatromicini]TYK52316.1 methyltransferase domain-containing protein [Actinomadura decatromicini]
MTESATREAYDAVAQLYADTFRDALADMTLDRAMLAAFADMVRGLGPVADLGCGPGRLTGHLVSLGLDAFGIDLSPEMIELARAEHPDLRFDVGTMASLDIADESVGGVLAWYSTIHTAPDDLPPVFAELYRVLVPGGHLLIGFQSCDGDEPVPYDHRVALAYLWPLEPMAALLGKTGFVEVCRVGRAALESERVPSGHLIVRKP